MHCMYTEKLYGLEILYLHHDAFLNLKQKYETWVYAYGQISWQEYLNKLITMNEVGVWVKDVIVVESKNF